MTNKSVDMELMRLVNDLINTGEKVIQLPASLVSSASDEILESIRQLAKLVGVTIEVQG